MTLTSVEAFAPVIEILNSNPALTRVGNRQSSAQFPDPVGPHLVYWLLVVHICAVIDEGNRDAYLTPIFSFIEELAQHPDEDVVGVIYVTVVEGLLDTFDEETLTRTIRMMGPTTRQITDEVAPSRRHCEQIRRLLIAASSPDRHTPPQEHQE